MIPPTPSSTPPFHPAHDVVEVWTFSLDTDITPWLDVLNTDEKARADRFYFPLHRQRFRAARILSKKILARYVQQDEAHLEFTEQQHGKPYVANAYGITFNLSHSQNVAVLAIGKMTMGVDIECLSARPYLGLAQHHFSSEEIKALECCPKAYQAFLFFKIWTQKEALIKACGLGLSYPTETFTTHLGNEPHSTVWDPLHQKWWHMHTYTQHAMQPVALCTEHRAEIVHYRLDEWF